ncbi:MAG: hypothetical protein JRJ44_00520 [Deltaproteobacteria bacterium]|nr:hypothetical protein [Deltaproteobacteria bacterium]
MFEGIIAAIIGLFKKKETGGEHKSFDIQAKGNINAESGAIVANTGIINKTEIINNYIIELSDYNKILADIKELEKDIAEPGLTSERRNEKVKELEKLREEKKRFKEHVFNLHETFTKIKINTQRLKKVKEPFENGRFSKADAILKAEELLKEQKGLLDAKKQKLKKIAELDENLKNNANEYLIKAQLTALRFDLPDRFEKASYYFRQSVNSFKTAENLFDYAYFLQKHNQFNKALPLYEEALQIYRKLAESNPQVYLPDIARTLNNMSMFYIESKPNRDKSITCAQEALDILLSFPNKTHAVQQYIEKAKELLRLNKAEIKE